MATWRDFAAFVRSSYEVSSSSPDMIELIFETDSGRSQAVHLWHRALMRGREDWLIIESPFASLANADLERVLKEADNLVCGGVVTDGRALIYRHAVPLANLDVNEFERPLELVTLAADRLEHSISGGDVY